MNTDHAVLLKKVATLRRENSHEHFELVEFRQADGEIIRRQYPRKMFNSASEVSRALLGDGAELPEERQQRKDVLEQLVHASLEETGILLAAAG